MSPFANAAANIPRNDDDDPGFNVIVEQVTKGECVLFLGSAVHSPSSSDPDIYPMAKRPSIGSELSLILAERSRFAHDLGNEDARNLQRVSLYHEMRLSRNDLVNQVKNHVQKDKEPSPMLELLARLNFPLVITTNYDQLFETAIEKVGKTYSRGVYNPESNRKTLNQYYFSAEAQSATALARNRTRIDSDNPFILKIHGDIVEDSASIVITDEDYIKFVLRMGERGVGNPVPEFVRSKLKEWPTLFIGYSLKDYNLRLLFTTLRWKIDPAKFPKMYSIDLRPDPLIREYWDDHKRYVSFIVTDLWEFIPRLYAKVPDTAKLPIHP